MNETIAIAVIIAAAGFLQGLTGFGFVLISLPLLGLLMPIKTIIPLVVMLALCVSLVLCFQLRRSVQFNRILTLFIATVCGIPLGVFTLKHIPATTLSLLLGGLMIGFATYQLIAKPAPRNLGLFPTIIAGFLSGILGGSIGAGGPPIIIFSAMQPWSKDEAKGTLAFFFVISGVAISVTHAYSGLITAEVMKIFLFTTPALAAGIFLGTVLYKHISDYGYQKLAFVLVFLLGGMMIYKNI